MNRPLFAAGLCAASIMLAGGCTVNRSPIHKWYFYDRQTGEPIDSVLLLEWAERNSAAGSEAQGFEQQVPPRETLADVRGVWLTRAEPGFQPRTRLNMAGYAMARPGGQPGPPGDWQSPALAAWTERSRYMACCPGYAFRVRFAGPEELAKLNVESAGDESVAYIMLTRQPDPAAAVDWLHWLVNGGPQLRNRLSPPQRKRVYQSFAACWDHAASAEPAQLQAELADRPRELHLDAELARIYREEIGSPPGHGP